MDSRFHFSASWIQLKRLFARRESARRLLFRLSDTDIAEKTSSVPTTTHMPTEVSTNLCFVGTSEGRLRGALLLSGLRSIVSALPRALLSASGAPAFAVHLLQTACTRISELTSTITTLGTSQLPLLSVVYRPAFVNIVTKLLRYVNHYHYSGSILMHLIA